MIALLVIGMVGLAVVVASLLFDDVLHRAFAFATFDVADGWISTPVFGAFLAAFGFGAALLLRGARLSPSAAMAGGALAGFALGGVTVALLRVLLRIPQEPAPDTGELVGALGTVVTRIPEDGVGEIAVTTAGQRMRLPASSDATIDSGTTVVVVDVTDGADAVVVTESAF